MADFNSAPSSSRSGRGTYDVFLSFRGEDVRNKFVDHIYAALNQKGIYTFKDDHMLPRGELISPELVKSIEESRSVIVVFSENYANSSWCLDELLKIMECRNLIGQRVLPVFYHVDPSDVRKQKGKFGKAFQQQEEKFGGDSEKLKKWKEALVTASNLSGFRFSNSDGGESEFVSKIVQDIFNNIKPYGLERNLIGLESHIDALNFLLDTKATKEVRVVGIWGMGGLGKTTIAQAVFRRIAYEFEGSSFVKDVRANSSNKQDICRIQEKILKDIMMMRHIMIHDCDEGAEMIQRFLSNKKVLLILDDVDNIKQKEFLAASQEWFGPGSRIIITTRDEHLLADSHFKYKPNCLLMDQAVELFSRHAFQKFRPPEGYEELTYQAINYTGCLPLALKVLGSFFHGRQANVWESALNRLAKSPNTEIFETLKLSFDGLDNSEKNIFLDIVCFFKGKDKEHVTRVLDSFDFDPVIGMSVLIEKSLITISKGRLDMHDLIQDMGWQIVRGSFPNSRLWQPEEMHDLIMSSRILPNLKYIDLRGSQYLTRFPDVSGAPNIEWLILSNCASLVDVHQSLGLHRRLFYLDMGGCWQLKHLPSRIEMESLETLILSSCPLVSFPEVLPCMVKLSKIYLDNCRFIEELPTSIRYLSGLTILNLRKCTYLKHIPDSICELKHLKSLDLYKCNNLQKLPEELGNMERLEELLFGSTEWAYAGEFTNFHYSTSFCSLKKLDLSWRQIEEEDFPKNFHAFSSLEELNLSGNSKLIQLPVGVSHLSNLKLLDLNKCRQLQSLLQLPSGLQILKARGCSSLENIKDLTEEYEWLYKLWFFDCYKLLEDEDNKRYVNKLLQKSSVKKCAAVNHRLSIAIPGSKIPSWFEEQWNGCNIELKLPPKWHTRIVGFAICGVFHGDWKYACPRIIFKIMNDGNNIPKLEVDNVSTEADDDINGNLWLSYIPLDFFQKMYHDIQPQDWYHIEEGNLLMTVMRTDDDKSVRCGAHVIYKDDMELIHQLKTCIPDYGNLVQVDGDNNHEELGYDYKASANTYVYEEKSDDKNSNMTTLLRSRILQRSNIYNRSFVHTNVASYRKFRGGSRGQTK